MSRIKEPPIKEPPIFCGPAVFAEYLERVYGEAVASRYKQVSSAPSAPRDPKRERPCRPPTTQTVGELTEKVLGYLAASGEKSAQEIAKHLKISKTHAYRLLSCLLDRGAIERTWGHRRQRPPLYLYRLAQAPSMKIAEVA